MDKKDIYEHLAEIYLDASSKRKKRRKAKPSIFQNRFFISIAFILALAGALFYNFQKNSPFKSEISLVLLSDAAKINFHFDPAKKEIYALDLNKLNLGRFKALAFSVKNASYPNPISLRIEFTNTFKEKSEVYIKNIPNKWKDYRIDLSGFRGLHDWSEISTLTFGIEEWNTKDKRGVVYIDNVRLLR
ncbi:MAG: hypothetical protein NT066_01205 [Candidatus Omnitrophica bacterium]|nr:hypothetical protein [Candidatus Omnitrophota bacterium]